MRYKTLTDLKLNREERLLLLCVQSLFNDENNYEIRSLLELDLDWDYFIKMAYEHKLFLIIFYQLNLICPDSIPIEVKSHLRSIFLENARLNLMFTGELISILDFFKSHEINVLPYKGPLLAVQAYNDLALRHFDDLDLFVNQNEVMKVYNLLVSKGYKAKFNLKKSQQEIFLRSQREYKFVNPINGITLEVHWKLIGSSFSLSNKNFLSKQKETRSIKINGRSFKTFSAEDMVMIICFHAAGNPWARLSWLVDIAKIIENEYIDWNKLLEETTKASAKRILLINLNLVNELFGLDLPKIVLDEISLDQSVYKISEKIKKNIFKIRSSNIILRVILRICIRERNLDKFKDFIKVLLQPTNKELELVNLPIILYPLYYIIRFFVVLTGKA